MLSLGGFGLGNKPTAEEVASASKISLDGKNAIVTGATSGIGKETARVLASMGARVILASRDEVSTEKTAQEIRDSTGNQNVEFIKLELSSLDSVRAFAAAFNSRKIPLHLLVLNAGLMGVPFKLTSQGYESQFGVNHLGHFYLTHLLLDRLQEGAPSRVIVLSSSGHHSGNFKAENLEDVALGKSYKPMQAYFNSKLLNVLFARELNDRYIGKGITAYSVHPGYVSTNLGRDLSFPMTLVWAITRPFYMTVPQGSATSIYCAVFPGIEKNAGGYFENAAASKPCDLGSNKDLAVASWEFSEGLINKFLGKK